MAGKLGNINQLYTATSCPGCPLACPLATLGLPCGGSVVRSAPWQGASLEGSLQGAVAGTGRPEGRQGRVTLGTNECTVATYILMSVQLSLNSGAGNARSAQRSARRSAPGSAAPQQAKNTPPYAARVTMQASHLKGPGADCRSRYVFFFAGGTVNLFRRVFICLHRCTGEKQVCCLHYGRTGLLGGKGAGRYTRPQLPLHLLLHPRLVKGGISERK